MLRNFNELAATAAEKQTTIWSRTNECAIEIVRKNHFDELKINQFEYLFFYHSDFDGQVPHFNRNFIAPKK